MPEQTFDAGWLALRERADHAARSRALIHALRVAGRRRGWSRVVDLGSGTGSNLRFTAGRVPWALDWVLVDHDEDLLSRVRPRTSDIRFRTVVADLAGGGFDVLDRADVVTGSALLDLVSQEWLGRLRDRCVSEGAAAYFALSYDGTTTWEGGSDSDVDALVLDAVNEHQLGDKGFGPALGPGAAAAAAELFQEAGYRVQSISSPWVLYGGGRDRRLMEALVEGWVEAAVELRPEDEARIREWGAARTGDAADSGVILEVGHTDLLALPPDEGAG